MFLFFNSASISSQRSSALKLPTNLTTVPFFIFSIAIGLYISRHSWSLSRFILAYPRASGSVWAMM